MIKTSIFLLSLCLLFFSCISRETHTTTTWDHDKGYVQDNVTAERIAEAVWLPIYGEDCVKNEKPYKSRLVGDSVWVVEGTLEEGMLGGTAYIEIAKKDGRILMVTHYK